MCRLEKERKLRLCKETLCKMCLWRLPCICFFFSKWTCVTLVLPVGLACFLQSGCYDWIPDRACRRSCVDPLSSQAAHIQVQVMHRKVAVWMWPGESFVCSVNLILFIIYCLLWLLFATCEEDHFMMTISVINNLILYTQSTKMYLSIFD